MISSDENQYKKALFAGGCFWCMESPFKKIEGVKEVISGYTGGPSKNPTYEEVCSGTSGHLEAVRVTYDPAQISYKELLEVFWQQVDPTDPGGQFVDRGPQYRTAIFYLDENQKREAEVSKEQLYAKGRHTSPIVTEILPASDFYPAEDYHQNFYIKEPVKYRTYRAHSGRDRYLEKIWK